MKSGLFSDISDQLGSLAKQTGKAVAKSPKSMVKTAASQIGVTPESEEEKAKNAQAQAKAQGQTPQGTDETKKVVDFLYGAQKDEVPKDGKVSKVSKGDESVGAGIKDALGIDTSKKEHFGVRDQTGISDLTKGQEKTPEEQQKLAQLRNTLHQEYYQKTFNRPKPQEERQAEKVEKEEKEEEQKKLVVEEKKKKKPIAVHRAENKIEKFRGASG